MRHPLSTFTSTNLVVPFHEVPSPRWFESAIRVLGRFYTFVGLEDVVAFVNDERQFNSCCHITFDDGHVSFYEHAVPVLGRLGIPATVFVSPRVIRERSTYWFQELTSYRDQLGDAAVREVVAGVLGCLVEQIAPFPINSVLLCLPVDDIKRVLEAVRSRHGLARPAPVNVTADQLRELAGSGLVTVGAHTLDHPVLGNETDRRAREEIQGSVAELSALVDRPVTAFAYPNGTEDFDFGLREQQFLREVGIRLAFSTDPGFVTRRTNPLAIPRGGCPSLEGEPDSRIAARVLLLPVWQRLSHVFAPGRKSEAQERDAIRAISPACRSHL